MKLSARFSSLSRAAVGAGVLTILTFSLSLPSQAQGGGQGQGQGGGRRGGFGGGQGFGGGFGRQGRGMQQQLNAASFTVETLTRQLGLTDAQKTQITGLLSGVKTQRETLDKQRAEMFQQFQNNQQNNGGNGGNGGGGGGRPQFDRAAFEKMRESGQALQTAETNADKEIRAALTPEQREKLNALMDDATMLQTLGIPHGVLGELTFTADEAAKLKDLRDATRREQQKRQLQMQNGGGNGGNTDFRAMMEEMQKAREATYQSALAVMTPEHKATVEAYVKAHPQPQRGGFGFGGPGGFGGGRGGQRGGGNRGGGNGGNGT